MRIASLCLGALAGLGALALAAPARADVVSAQASIHGGYATGEGSSGPRRDEAFHAGARGPAVGVAVGVEVLFIDVWVQHDQYRGGDGLVGTWTQFMTGIDVALDLGEVAPGEPDDDGQPTEGHAPGYLEIGGALGFGVGTGRQVDPPLDNGEVTDKGFIAQASAGVGWRMTRHLSLGLAVPVQAAYLFKSGPGAVANDGDSNYSEINVAALVTLRAKLEL